MWVLKTVNDFFFFESNANYGRAHGQARVIMLMQVDVEIGLESLPVSLAEASGLNVNGDAAL